VHAQHEALSREMSAPRAEPRMETREMTRLTADEPIMLGGIDAPAIAESPARRQPQQPMRDMGEIQREMRGPREGFGAPPPKRGVFGGLFGRPRAGQPMEPTVAPPRPRATAQVITRSQPVARDPGRRATDAPGQHRQPITQPDPQAEDLFAGQGEGTDFEIPAFLRRHANSGQ
jgi:hypothetical protein